MKEAAFVLALLSVGFVIGTFMIMLNTPPYSAKTEVNEHRLMLKGSNVPVEINTIEYDGQEYLVFHGGFCFSVCPKKAQ